MQKHKCVSERCLCKKSRKHCTLLCDSLICENIEKIDGGKKRSDSTEDFEPEEEDEPLTSESEPEDDASDDEEEALDLDWIIYKIDM